MQATGTVTFFLYFDDREHAEHAHAALTVDGFSCHHVDPPEDAVDPSWSVTAGRELRDSEVEAVFVRVQEIAAASGGRVGRDRHAVAEPPGTLAPGLERVRPRAMRRLDLGVAVSERGEEALVLARSDVDALGQEMPEERRVALGVELLHPGHGSRPGPTKSVSIAPTR